MEVFMVLAIIAALVWFWLDSMRAREVGLRRCKSMCVQMNEQLLDQTVHVARLLARGGANAAGYGCVVSMSTNSASTGRIAGMG